MSFRLQFLKDAELLDQFGFYELAQKIEKIAISDKRIVVANNQNAPKPGKFNFVADQSKKDEVNKNHIYLIYQKVIQSGCDISYLSEDFFSLLGTLKYIPIINIEQDRKYNDDHNDRFHRIAESIENKDAYSLLLACFFKKQTYNTGGYDSFSDQFRNKVSRLNDIHGFPTGRRLDFKDAIYFYEASVNPNASKNVFANRVLPSMNDFLDLLFEKFNFDPAIHNETAESLYKINYVFGPKSLEYIKKFSPEIDLNDTEQKLDPHTIHDPAQRLPINFFQPQGISGETIVTQSGTELRETEIKDGYDINVTGMGNFILANSVNNFQNHIDDIDLSIVSNENKENDVRKALINFLKPYETLDYNALSQNKSKIIEEFDEKYKRILKKSIIHVITFIFEKCMDKEYTKLLPSWNRKVFVDDAEYPIRQLIGKLSFEEINAIIDSDALIRKIGIENIKDMEFARAFLKYGEYGGDPYYFQIAQDLYLNNQDKEPNWAGKIIKSGNLTGRILPKSDKRFLFVGNITGCCQKLDGAARESCHDSIENSFSSIFVIENINGRIQAQAYVWEDKNGKIVFDSFETKNKDAEFNIDCYNIIKEISKEFSADVFIGAWNSVKPQEIENYSGPKITSNFFNKHNNGVYDGDLRNIVPLNIEVKDSYDLDNMDDFGRVADLVYLDQKRLKEFENHKNCIKLIRHISQSYGKLKFDQVKDLKPEILDNIAVEISDSFDAIAGMALNSSVVKNFREDAKNYLKMQKWILDDLVDIQARDDNFNGSATYTPVKFVAIFSDGEESDMSYENLPLRGIMTMIKRSQWNVAKETAFDINSFKQYGIYFDKSTVTTIVANHPNMKIPSDLDLSENARLIEYNRDPQNIKELLTDENGNIKQSEKLDKAFVDAIVDQQSFNFVMDCGYVFLNNPMPFIIHGGLLDFSYSEDGSHINEKLQRYINNSKPYKYSDYILRNIIFDPDEQYSKSLKHDDPEHHDDLTDFEKIIYADKPFKDKVPELDQIMNNSWWYIKDHVRIYGGKFQETDIDYILKYMNNITNWNLQYPLVAERVKEKLKQTLNNVNAFDISELFDKFGGNYKVSNREIISQIFREFMGIAPENTTEETP
jgi:hypothetical protein